MKDKGTEILIKEIARILTESGDFESVKNAYIFACGLCGV